MKRIWRYLRVTLLTVAALVAVALIVNGLVRWRNGVRLEAKIVALQVAGDPVSLADFSKPSIKLENNAAVYLRRARREMEAIEKELLDNGADSEEHLRRGLSDEVGARGIRAVFEAHPKVIPLLDQAAACDDFVVQIDPTIGLSAYLKELIAEYPCWRSSARLYYWRIRLLLAEGDREGAAACCQKMLRLSRQFDHAPMFISNLIACAIRSVALNATAQVVLSGPLSPAAHASLEAELAADNIEKSFQDCLRTERVYGLQSSREHPMNSSVNWLRPYWMTDDLLIYLELFDALIAAPLDPFSSSPDVRELGELAKGAGPLVDDIVPAIEAQRASVCRVLALNRALRVFNALCAHDANAAGGQVAIADLGLPTDATTDPFDVDNSPLRIKKLPAGWVVYSVGVDQKDDGGQISGDMLDVGWGPTAFDD